MKTSTQTVGSHVALINFGGAQVPVGFIASFRKKNHFLCESGKGFTIVTVKGERTNHLCQCAIPRAAKKLREVGVKGMEELGIEWKERAMVEVKASEMKCREEGKAAREGVTCPYQEKTDQQIAWQEGYDEAHGTYLGHPL
jgi:hypothetical protein